MTKQEYNENLKRYHKAMDWYHNTKDAKQQEKFLPSFEKILEKLRVGALELTPNEKEILGGFKLE